MYNALDIAKYIIKFENDKDRCISNLRLQKLLYFIQCDFIIQLKRPCFYNDIEAWVFGAVIPDVYYKYKFFGSANIPYSYIKWYCKPDFLDNEQNIIDSVIINCSKFSNTQLGRIVQNQDPWIIAYHKSIDNKITNKLIDKFFNSK